MRWSRAPISRIVIPFALGIAYGLLWDTPSLLLCVFLTLSFFTFFIAAHFYFRRLPYRQRWLPGFLISVTLLFAGIMLVNAHKADSKPDYFEKNYNPESKNEALLLRLTNPPEEKNKTYKVIAEVKAIIKPGKLVPASGNILLYFKKDSLSRKLEYGDVILTYSKPQLIPKPANPEEFDYHRYMAFRNVYHQVFFNEQNWVKAKVKESKPGWQFLFSLQKQWAAFFDENITGRDEAAIAKALVLGNVSELSPQLRSSYAATGTMHILAVSGLHVGFIFLGLGFITRTLENNRYGKYFRAIIIIGTLWLYAFLTGLSPSVFRAVAMFSFVAIGQNFRRITNTYNSIATAALILLIADPFLLAHVGFQLSFAAVIGIVWLHPKIVGLWQIENKIISWLWSLTAVSIAAQLATFPLGLFYFQQFPVYFIPANFIAIPAAMLILGLGFVFIILKIAQLSFLFTWIGKVLYWIIAGLNYSMEKIKAFPAALLDGIYINKTEAFLIYLVIVILIFSFIHKNKHWLKLSLSLFIVFLIQRIIFVFLAYRQPQIVVHSLPKNFAMSIREEDKLYLIGDSSFIKDNSKVDFLISSFAAKSFISKNKVFKKSLETDVLQETEGIYLEKYAGQFQNIKWLVINKNTDVKNTDQNIELDYLILAGNPKINISKIPEKLRFKTLIITRNNSRFSAAKWDNECKELNIDCLNMQKDNSFVVMK